MQMSFNYLIKHSCSIFSYTFLYISLLVFLSHNAMAEVQSTNKEKIAADYQALLEKYNFDMSDIGAEGKNSELKRQKITADNSRKFTLSDTRVKQLMKDMIWVEGGSFTMGSEAPEATNREKPAHKVTLDGFFIGKTEVTQVLFEELMGWNVSYFPCEQCAINNVSWSNIQLFIQRLNKVTGKTFRLPTEAEWEYAAKGGNKSKKFRFSGSNNIEDVAWYEGNGENKSRPVALKKPNELGIYDMTGNLWEFVHDDMYRSIYTKEERVNPVYIKSDNPKKKSMKVIRGGGYEFSADESLVFKRDGATNNVRMPDIGFRLALTSM